MERTAHTPEVYDFRQHDRVWQRVAPGLEPYPAVPAMAELPEDTLPGAEPNPCCMGTAAEEVLAVLTGFIEEELESGRYYQALLRCAPAWARPRMRELAMEKDRHVRHLSAAYFLITGSCYQPTVACGRVRVGTWCAALRERYHVEACGWMNYQRAAEGTTDPCLQRIFTTLAESARRHADWLMSLLERSLQR
ncbi:MAG: ferritin-like domain-containing protein [Oscillibacter sp.]|nr:ferritin-like domain-containing protein [Oscillibacter sp.]